MNPKEIETPHVTKELLEYLKKVVPNKDFKPEDGRDEIMFYSGKRALINHLKQINEDK